MGSEPPRDAGEETPWLLRPPRGGAFGAAFGACAMASATRVATVVAGGPRVADRRRAWSGIRVAHATRVRTLASLTMICLALGACATVDDEPTPGELSALDAWAQVADGKADLPGSYTSLVAWLRDAYRNRMSAIWNDQERLASPSAALSRIAALSRAAGTDPMRALYPATVRRLDTGTIDHSELDIALPGGTVVRLVGDPKGSGAYLDRAAFEAPVGPKLCFTYDELATAVTAAYVPGAYGIDFVCHNVTERVMRALGIGTARFSSQFRTYAAARWAWGPVTPSFNPQDGWPALRRCP